MKNTLNLAEGKNFISVNGVQIYYKARITDTKRRTLILIHGAGAFAESWNGVTDRFLEDEFNHVTLDMQGHFRSKGKAFMSIEENADFINNFVHALKDEYELVDNFVVVGHPFGGAVTIELALREYGWLKRIVLVGTSADFTKASTQEFLEKLKNGEMDLDFYKRGFSPSTPSAYYDNVVKVVSNVSLESTYADFYATSSFNRKSDFNKIKVPMFIISGEDDVIMSEGSAQFMFDNSDGTTQWLNLEKTGHFITTEKPVDVAIGIQNFVMN